jgi:hypothetical protein
MNERPEIVDKFRPFFEGCDELLTFARSHRPQRQEHEARLIVSGTLARSDATFNCVVKLCRCGHGEHASMLNRTLFEDMISAHWAAKYPARASRLLRRHDEFVRVRRARAYDKHHLDYDLSSPLPSWTPERRRRMRTLFARGSWTGRSIPTMVAQVESMWAEADRERLHGLHDVWHQGHNMLIHYSARTLSFRVSEDAEGKQTFATGASERFIGTALGFAFWTYANTISLGLDGEALAELNSLATRYDRLVPDRHAKYKMDAPDEN